MSKSRQDGFLTAELLVTIMLLGLIVAGLALSMHGFSGFNQYQWARQCCTAAALAELDSITAGVPIEQQELERLWPHVRVSVDRSPAGPPWDGLDTVQVTATTRRVHIRLVRYVPTESVAVEGGRI